MDCSNVNYIRATRLVRIGVIISKIESKYLIMGGEYQDTKGTYLFRYVPELCVENIWNQKSGQEKQSKIIISITDIFMNELKLCPI